MSSNGMPSLSVATDVNCVRVWWGCSVWAGGRCNDMAILIIFGGKSSDSLAEIVASKSRVTLFSLSSGNDPTGS
jgi:hypothetical protein